MAGVQSNTFVRPATSEDDSYDGIDSNAQLIREDSNKERHVVLVLSGFFQVFMGI